MIDKYIFDTPNYQKAANLDSKEHSFIFLDYKLIVYPVITEEILEIGKNATFGGVYFSNSIDNKGILNLLNQFYSWGSGQSRSYKIRIPPQYLEPNIYPVLQDFFESKAATVIVEKNQHLCLSRLGYKDHFSKTNKKIVRKSLDQGLYISIDKNLTSEGYKLLEKNRLRRNLSLSLSYSSLLIQASLMSDQYLYFSCYDSTEKLLAYAVCVIVKEDVIYVLYWGEDPQYRKASPVVFLAMKIIDYCNENNINYLDAGISSVNGEIDQNLFEFKSRLGFVSSDKLIIKGDYA